MSKKVTNKSLVEQALNENAKQEEVKSCFVPFVDSSLSSNGKRGSNNRVFMFVPTPFVEYPPTLTDQTHALTLAEQVRRGQGDAERPDKNLFDFPDGKDDGSQAHGIFEFSERVDRWIAEQNLSSELAQSFRQQVLNHQQIVKENAKVDSVSETTAENPSTSEK